MNRGVPILMYHALSAAHTAAFWRWTLAPDRFEAHLDYLSRSGYSTITIAELLRRRPAAQAGRDRVIVLTFLCPSEVQRVGNRAAVADPLWDDRHAVRTDRPCRWVQQVDVP